MDLGDYWQENKRFVLGASLAGLLFLIAFSMVRSHYEDDIRKRRREIAERRADLAQPMFDANALADARLENEALRAAVEQLGQATEFQAREEFRLQAGRGAPNAQYLRVLAGVREELLQRANRANLDLDPSLGMPSLSPTREVEIERHLEALDVVEQLTDLALRAEVERVEDIRIKLDPGLRARDGLGRIERTRISATLTGTSLAVTRVLTWARRPPVGRVLHLLDVKLSPSRSKAEEVTLEVTLVVAHRLVEPEAS